MSTYNLKTADGDFIITKFDDDLNPESSYRVNAASCECPQWVGRSKTCRHMKMLPLMEDRADTPWFYDFDTGLWSDPTGQAEGIPDGVTMVSLDDPAKLHNAIANAVGEPGDGLGFEQGIDYEETYAAEAQTTPTPTPSGLRRI